MNKKWILVAVIAVVIGLFVHFDLGSYLTLESLKENKVRLDEYYQENQALMIGGFILIYIVMAGLSLPGATIMTLAGGAVFGSITGTLATNVGATLGATLAFLMARYVLRDWVEEKYGHRLKPFNEGFANNAINYMLFLRLVPLFPFFLVNLASGLTRVNIPVYFFGTMFGTLPGTFVYANAGSNLASIESLSDIASPGVLGAFTLLGLFALIPTLYKKFKQKKAAAPAADL